MLVAVVVVIVLVAGYFGFVPGISNIFGSNKPVGMDTTYTPQDYKNANAKSGIQFTDLPETTPAEQSIKVSGPARPVNVDFTESEFLALLNERPGSSALTPMAPLSSLPSSCWIASMAMPRQWASPKIPHSTS